MAHHHRGMALLDVHDRMQGARSGQPHRGTGKARRFGIRRPMVDHGGAPAQGARRGHYRLRIGSRAANQQVRRRGEELNECP
jgi:hypothetical protein